MLSLLPVNQSTAADGVRIICRVWRSEKFSVVFRRARHQTKPLIFNIHTLIVFSRNQRARQNHNSLLKHQILEHHVILDKWDTYPLRWLRNNDFGRLWPSFTKEYVYDKVQFRPHTILYYIYIYKYYSYNIYI